MAKYSVFILPSAEKEIAKLEKKARERIFQLLLKLENDPRPPGCKKLVGTNAWRIRSGELRVVYTIEDHILQIEVVRVAHRKEVYR